jgi:DNA-binding MarR family transcriptional regulator
MDALDLIVLGRRLAKIGETAMRGSPAPARPTGTSLVARDVLAHPGSSVTEIAARTGLPQSYVSESVDRLRKQGFAETVVDPSDRRRTLVRVSAKQSRAVARMAAVSADAALAEALGERDPRRATEIIEQLSAIADRIRPTEPGPILRELRRAQQET